MSRAYTVEEVDDLRYVLGERYIWGTCYWEPGPGGGRSSGSYSEKDKVQAVEALIRTAMLAGHTADDFRRADRERWERQRAREAHP